MEKGVRTVNNLIKEFNNKLAGCYQNDEIRQITYMLFEEYLGWTKTTVHLSYNAEIPLETIKLFINALDDLCKGKPVQYILGKAWFNGILLTVDPGVLIPRPETEELCAMIGNRCLGLQNQEISILDIGTGSGCIAIDLKKQFPGASVTGIDTSKSALDIASENARKNGYDIDFILSDILNREDWRGLLRYHVIVSNPPYVAESEKKFMQPNVTEFEPAQALFVPENDSLLFYHTIAEFADVHLIRPGYLFFEINERFGAEVCNLLLSAGFAEAEVLKDIHGKDRFVAAILL